MAKLPLTLILVSVTLSAVAQLLFKLGVSPSAEINELSVGGKLVAALLSPAVLGGLALYGIGTIVWLAALARTPLSQAYPFVGLGFLFTAVFGHVFLSEEFGMLRIVGTILVIAGISLIARS
jgi:drug/metabolite transporter (DMT)-like permease